MYPERGGSCRQIMPLALFSWVSRTVPFWLGKSGSVTPNPMNKIIFIPILFLLSACSANQISIKAIPEPEIKTVCSCRSDRYNCADFKTRREAREVYECCMKKVGYDIHRLDRDSDGIACEW